MLSKSCMNKGTRANFTQISSVWLLSKSTYMRCDADDAFDFDERAYVCKLPWKCSFIKI